MYTVAQKSGGEKGKRFIPLQALYHTRRLKGECDKCWANPKTMTQITKWYSLMSQKGDKMESQSYIQLIPNKIEKERKGTKNQMGQIGNKQQENRVKPNDINNYINDKEPKHSN